MAELLTFENLVALVTLTSLEIVLGIDNVVFIAILAAKLPAAQQARARRVGLGLAMLMRILLLLTIGWIMGLTAELFSFPVFWTAEPGDRHGVSARDLVMLAGGLFLIGKATYEIHDKLEGAVPGHARPGGAPRFSVVVTQIVLIDIVFSLDSVITAIGMVQAEPDKQWIGVTIMITAVIIAVLVMLIFAGAIAAFVERRPTMKILALAFLILIGVVLVADGLHVHIPKGYVYFAMAFSLVVELINMRIRPTTVPAVLHQSYVVPDSYPPAADSRKS
jgi:predicted tellurium resistance membrane protein TerC